MSALRKLVSAAETLCMHDEQVCIKHVTERSFMHANHFLLPPTAAFPDHPSLEVVTTLPRDDLIDKELSTLFPSSRCAHVPK